MNDGSVLLDSGRIAGTLDDIAAIGNRFAGSPGEIACRDYLLERFGELDVAELRLEPFHYLGFERAEASCAVEGHEQQLELECHPLQYTSGEAVTGEAVYLGAAGDDDFARIDRGGVDLAGRIVLAHAIFPFDLCDELQRRGIAGFVHICETPDPIVGHFTGALYPPPLQPPWPGRPQPYTGVTIGNAAGRALLSAMTCGAPVTISLSHDGAYAEGLAHNVVAEIPGTGDGDEHVIVSAHYDSQAEGPCVYDNGTGLAGLLECARALARAGARRRIVLIASACEEIGVWGATAYAHAHADELGAAAAMVNLDGLASAYPAEREIWSADAAIARMAEETARELGWIPDRVMNVRSTFSDHAPFGDAGVPSCLIWRPEYPYYHSRGDVRELVDAAAVAETASVAATLVSRLAHGADVRGSAVSAT
jgi:aminopeptidase YwaD